MHSRTSGDLYRLNNILPDPTKGNSIKIKSSEIIKLYQKTAEKIQ